MVTRPGELHKGWGLSLKENAHKLKFNMGQYFYLYGYEKYSIVCFFGCCFVLLLNISYCTEFKRGLEHTL